MRGSCLKRLIAFTFALQVSRDANGELQAQRGSNGTKITIPYVVPLLELLGLQNGNFSNLTGKALNKERNQIRCDKITSGQVDTMDDFKDSAILIPFGKGVDETCGGYLGSWASMEGIADLCSHSSVVLLAYPNGLYPGLFSKTQPGDNYSSLQVKYGPKLWNCAIVAFEIPSKADFHFLFHPRFDDSSHLALTISIDANIASNVYEDGFVRFLFRGFIPLIAFYGVARSLRIFWIRLTSKKLEKIHLFMLFSNFVIMTGIGVLDISGANFLTTNLSYNVNIALLIIGSGTGVASHFVLALMYYNLLQAVKFGSLKTLLSARRATYVFTSLSLCLMEYVAIILSFLPSTSTVAFLFVGVPAVSLCLQILVILFLAFQVREMVRFFQLGNQYHGKSTDTSRIEILHRQLVYWIRWTIFFAGCTTIARFMYLFMISFRSPTAFLVTVFIYQVGMIGCSLSQAESAKLPQKNDNPLRFSTYSISPMSLFSMQHMILGVPFNKTKIKYRHSL